MKVTKRSPLTDVEHTMDLPVTQEELDRHAAGEFSQDIWPHLDAAEREFLISGITPEEWVAAFGQEDYDLDGTGEVWEGSPRAEKENDCGV